MDEVFAEKLNLTSDEATKLKTAFQDKDFIKLFQDYAENVSKPESRKQYEDEIISLEKSRGFNVKFIHPDPLYVMKYIVNRRKLFINICQNEHVREANFERKSAGTECQIPVIFSKPREDYDKKKEKCTVIDVMFHPKTMEISALNPRFRQAVEDTARTTVESQFGFGSLANPKYPKLKYKGTPPSLILRQNGEGQAVECESLKEYCKKRLEAGKKVEGKLLKGRKQDESKLNLVASLNPPTPKQPKYSVKYRDVIDMKDYSLMGYTDLTAPKAIILEVHLPEVESASDIDLDVFEKKFQLKSQSGRYHNYFLELDFSYAVDKNSGTAKFEKTLKTLTVMLPVKDRGIPKLEK